MIFINITSQYKMNFGVSILILIIFGAGSLVNSTVIAFPQNKCIVHWPVLGLQH